MTTPPTPRAPITPLNPTLRRIAQHLVDGHTTQDITTKTGLSPESIRQHLRDIRKSVHCPPRSKPPVLAHYLLTAQQATPPSTDLPTPDLTPGQHLLLRAVAEHSTLPEIALAARIAPVDARAALDALLAATGAADLTQLVARAHAWGLLGTAPAVTHGPHQ